MDPAIISVIIVEDDNQIREGITTLLSTTEGFKLIAAYESCEKFLKEIKNNLPDVILMDISMPGMTGIECVKKITAEYSGLKIIMLTVYEEEQKIFDSLRAGASGYILKRSPLQEILSSIKEVMSGGGPLSPVIAKKVLNFFNLSGKKKSELNLTNREVEILKELVEGHSYKKISEKLFISLDTVRSHIKGIYQKLHVNSKSEAVAKALKENLL